MTQINLKEFTVKIIFSLQSWYMFLRFGNADVPFLSDFRHYFEVAGWPANEFSDWLYRFYS